MVSESMPLYDILNEFQKGHSHIAVVIKDLSETKEPPRITKEVKPIKTKLTNKKQKGQPDSTSLNAEHNEGSPNAVTQIQGVKLELRDSHTVVTSKDVDQESRIRPLSVPGLKKRHKGCSHCILDVENAPIPEFPPNEEVVGVITMEDVIEELLQEEILDETDEYINIHNRIKVNMQASQGKTANLNSAEPSPTLSSVACTPTPTPTSPMSMGNGLTQRSTPTLSVSTGTSVTGSPKDTFSWV